MHCAAVAIELYLKALSAEDVYVSTELTPVTGVQRVHARSAVHSHELSELLAKISPVIRSQLTDAFESSGLSRKASSFEQLLKQFEGLFVYSRYPFEKRHQGKEYPPLNTLGALVVFLHDFTAAT